MLADLTTVTQLVKSWIEVHRGESAANPPVFNLPSLFSSSQPFSQTKSAEFYAAKSKAETTSVKMHSQTCN
jgi:hypothetical protein